MAGEEDIRMQADGSSLALDGEAKRSSLNPRILIVEDEEALATLLRYNLELEGFDVDVVSRGEDAEVAVAEARPDLLVLDWMLPGISGLELCRRIRSSRLTKSIPILMLTAKSEEHDRIRGLTTGADDYVTKPFSIAEVIARVKAIMRRANPDRLASHLVVGDIEVDREGHRVTRGKREVHLGPTEYRLLVHFMQNTGRVLSRAQILDGIWGRDVYVDERTVDVHVGRLRRALVRGRDKDPVRTVRGAGYVMGERTPGAV